MGLLGIDLGTTGCKAVVFSPDGKCHSFAYREYPAVKSPPGIFELDSNQVWLEVKNVIRMAVAKSRRNDPVTALSVCSFGEAFVPVTRGREILADSVLSCDNRGGKYIDGLKERISQKDFYRINPNILSVNYSMPKIRWLKDNCRDVYEKADYFLLWADFVSFMLGAEPCTANSLASRTLLFDIEKNDWSEKLLELTGLDKCKFAKIVNAGDFTGEVSDGMAAELGLPPGVKIIAGAHDQCCNALGAGAVDEGAVSCGIGTYQCMTMLYRKPQNPMLFLNMNLNIEHHVVQGLYASFIFNQAGMLTQWFQNIFAGEIDDSKKAFALFEEEIPEEISDVFAFPYFEATGAPEYINNATGLFAGLKVSAKRGEIYKALLEGIDFYFIAPLNKLKTNGIDVKKLIITGGGSVSDKWAQIKADIFGIPVIRPAFTECGVTGSAILAGLGTEVFSSVKNCSTLFAGNNKEFTPNWENNKRYKEKYNRYKNLFAGFYSVWNDNDALQKMKI